MGEEGGLIDLASGMVRVDFELDPEQWHGGGSEGFWATPCGVDDQGRRLFKLENSPFYFTGVSWGDIVVGAPAEGGRFAFSGIHKRSGNSTLMMLAEPDDEVSATLNTLKALGCSWESADEFIQGRPTKLYSLNVPLTSDRVAVWKLMSEAGAKEVWLFQVGFWFNETEMTSE